MVYTPKRFYYKKPAPEGAGGSEVHLQHERRIAHPRRLKVIIGPFFYGSCAFCEWSSLGIQALLHPLPPLQLPLQEQGQELHCFFVQRGLLLFLFVFVQVSVSYY
jgi:hypothetical protein